MWKKFSLVPTNDTASGDSAILLGKTSIPLRPEMQVFFQIKFVFLVYYFEKADNLLKYMEHPHQTVSKPTS